MGFVVTSSDREAALVNLGIKPGTYTTVPPNVWVVPMSMDVVLLWSSWFH